MNRRLVVGAVLVLLVTPLIHRDDVGAVPYARAQTSPTLTFEPGLPLVNQTFTVSITVYEPVSGVGLSVDRWESAQRLDGPWDSSGHEGEPDVAHSGGWYWRWDWHVKVTQPGDYTFTFYKDCATDCTAVVQATVTAYSPDQVTIAFEPPVPAVGEFFQVCIISEASFAGVELGIDNWQWAERTSGPWSSSGREDKPNVSDGGVGDPGAWGWIVKVTQPSDYAFTFYKDCHDGCYAVVQAALTVSEPETPIPTTVPTEQPPSTPTTVPTTAPTSTPTAIPTDEPGTAPTRESPLPTPAPVPTQQSPLPSPVAALAAGRGWHVAPTAAPTSPPTLNTSLSQPDSWLAALAHGVSKPSAVIGVLAALLTGTVGTVVLARFWWPRRAAPQTAAGGTEDQGTVRPATAIRAAKVKVILERRRITQEAACHHMLLSPRRYRDVRDRPEVEQLAEELRNRQIEEWW